MKISALTIEDLRIIRRLSLSPEDGINIVSGANGAGKTSILEAIYLAGRGRTFRHTEARPLVRGGAEQAVVLVKLRDNGSESVSTLGISRGAKAFRCRLNGVDLTRRSELAATLPVQWIGSQPQILLDLGPDVRRRFLDMAVFHVEPAYLKTLADFQRALRQRNGALRKGGDSAAVRVWDRPLSDAGEQIDRDRRSVLEAIFRQFRKILDQWRLDFSVNYRYRSGWTRDHGLREELEARVDDDIQRGFTGRGPHRAELEILCDSGLAQKVLSRGQQKMLVIALHLATFDYIAERARSRRPILLFDDLAAELDVSNRARVLDALEARDGQYFVTRLTDDRLPLTSRRAVFHVEHGQLV
jgi:DNA replication and repair protein RecF